MSEPFSLVVNERFRIERDTHSWMIVEQRPGESREGEPITTEKRSYHARLSHALIRVIDITAGSTDGSPAAIIAAINHSTAEIQAACLMIGFK